jgi:hypothetical protein
MSQMGQRRLGRFGTRAADAARKAGDRVRSRLIGDAEGRAMLVVFSTCRDTIRTLPALQHDPARPEDVDTNDEDHAGDDIRYACMSRPWVAPAKVAPEKKRDSWERFLEGDDGPAAAPRAIKKARHTGRASSRVKSANYFCWPAGLSVLGLASPWFCCGAGVVAGSTLVVPGATGF